MNRLWVRLTLALGLVTLVGVGTVALLTNWQAGEEFRQYVARQDSQLYSPLLDDLAAYYLRSSSWAGVDTVMATYTVTVPIGRPRLPDRGHPPLMLADAAGQVMYDEHDTPRVGQTLARDELQGALTIEANGRTVGYLVVRLPWWRGPDTIEQGFINRLRMVLVIAALLAGSLSLVLGAVLSRTLAAPLANLAKAARALAARDWAHRIPERGTAEVADAARAFNEMAGSLEQSETLRRNLMADIAHELRTPLTVLQGNLRAMLDGVYPLERSEIATLYDETRHLNRLVDDLRELALAEAGQLPVSRQATDLTRLLAAVADNFGVAAEDKRVAIRLEAPTPLPPVLTDVDRVRQVLVNLMSNALRHTPEGGHIALCAEPAAGALRVTVTDTGEGIAPEDLLHVFDRFYTADKARARNWTNGGSGLGLAVARAWVQALGGQIGAESTLHQGSRFWFTLPLA